MSLLEIIVWLVCTALIVGTVIYYFHTLPPRGEIEKLNRDRLP